MTDYYYYYLFLYLSSYKSSWGLISKFLSKKTLKERKTYYTMLSNIVSILYWVVTIPYAEL